MEVLRMLRDILLPLTGTTGDDTALRYALGLAATRDAHLTVLVPVQYPTPMPSPWGIAPDKVIASMTGHIDADAQARAQAIRESVGDAPCSWDVVVDAPTYDEMRACARRGRIADLCVIPAPIRGADDASFARAYFSVMLFESGRPLLVVPAECAAPSRFHRATVAWDSSMEASRALHGAISLGIFDHQTALECAMVDASPGANSATAQPLQDHLSRHDIAPTVTHLTCNGQSVATRLLIHAAHSRSQLLIAGGYGHSRLREWLLGGTTRDLLAGTPIPILFAH
ncbi:universal stress protein [Lysobacter sp. KIS68-7]|uniref:universal stress protein n=1 Tax=Lysobacter sp. KIS68-7 TaxID=2904252 RepID=UPI001E426F8E|nr:universal stress protein [Lysobacter sp. KIS68-7]UHQ18321.1 universal stress protein [Lysobacter sp. KIS68-7]